MSVTRVVRQAAGLASVTACFCLLPFVVTVLGEPPQGVTRPPGYADLLRALDCATREDQLLAVLPESYAAPSFRVRYLYPVPASTEANLLNMIRDSNRLAMVLYHGDGRSAALFEVGFNGSPSKRTFSLRDGANLEKQGAQWVVKNILNGGASTWPEIVRHSDAASEKPLMVVPRAAVTRTSATCEFPPSGLIFSAVSISGDQSNWKFKDGASEGIPFKTQSGPFHNSDLNRVPSRRVYMNTYGLD